MPPSNDDFVRQVVSRMYGTITVDKDLGAFFSDNISSFLRKQDDRGDDEHDLGWTGIYRQFEALMERKLGEIGAQLGYPDERAFYEELRARLDSDGSKDGKQQRMVDLIVSSYDYGKFVALMRIKAKSLAAKREEEKMGEEEKEEEEEEEGKEGEGKEEEGGEGEEEEACSEMFEDDSN